MKKKIVKLITLVMLLSMLLPTTVFAAENNWVLDEMNVLSQETMDYIENLNENVFPNYENKPQLAIMIIDELPAGYTMDEYKLEQFNAYGVGTRKENCGLLFMFAIEDREYGLEIGEGYERGSSLRTALETDFVNSDIKELLRAENYDAATMEIVKHLETILANEEAGIYTQKDIEREEADKAFASFMLAALAIGAVGIAVYQIGKRIYVVFMVNRALTKYEDLIAYTKHDKKAYQKDYVRNILYNGVYNIERRVLEYLYREYKECCEVKFYNIGRHSRNDLYMNYLRDENTLEKFKNKVLTSLEDIVYIVDKEEDEKERVYKYNCEQVDAYIADHLSEIDERVNVNTLAANMKKNCSEHAEFSLKDIESIFVKHHNELIFDFEYEKFLEENSGSINRHFKKSDFYREIRNHSEYDNYVRGGYRNNSWMLPLLVAHMANNKRSYDRRQRSQAAARRSSSSSYGRSFGGGFSRGGGFSGGW